MPLFKLGKIDAEELALDVAAKVRTRAEALIRVSSRGALRIETTIADAPIGGDVRLLVTYASTGEDRHHVAEAALDTVASVLWGSAAHPTTRPLGNQGTAIGTVFVAALARVAIAQGKPVAAHGVAALAGVSVDHVCTLSGGKAPLLRRAGGGRRNVSIEAASAAAWLADRGVPGFMAKRPARKQST